MDKNTNSSRKCDTGGISVVQAEYKKEWMDTYLWILPEHQIEDSYIEKMLLHNQGEGRLEFSKQQKEGEEYYCYKITGKKALHSVYSMMTIGERQIRSILQQLFTTLENGKEYLLAEEDFVLSPTYIFATFPQMDMELCYVPGYGVPLKEQLEGLFEYLLNRADYEDKKAVELLYSCYMFCMKEQGGLQEIKKLLVQEVSKSIESKEDFLGQARIEEKELTQAKSKLDIMDNYRRSLKTEYLKQEKEQQKIEGLVQEKKQSKKKVSSKEKKQKKITYPEAEDNRNIQTTSYISWLSNFFLHKQKKELLLAEEQEEYRVEPMKEEKIEELERTVLLSMVSKEEVVLICESSGEIISLTKFPFYIGSTADYVDYVLTAGGVSRIHCCISKKGDSYYLADLNSTNGTYLNKKEVMPGKDELLSANDEIRIASVKFYIKFSCH